MLNQIKQLNLLLLLPLFYQVEYKGKKVIQKSPLDIVLDNHLPELEFCKNLPTVWDDTKVLSGEIGKYAIVARRNGKAWFVGAITNDNGRKLSIKLDFLPEGKKYIAHIYADDAAVATKTHVRVETRNVHLSSVIDTDLVGSGGLAGTC